MRLLLLHPEVAFRSCADCQKWLYNEETGKPHMRRGKPLERGAAIATPCRTSTGCPKGTPENPKSLNDRNIQVYAHYLECKAVGCFPDDEIVRRNASIISQVESQLKRRNDEELRLLLRAFASRPTL